MHLLDACKELLDKKDEPIEFTNGESKIFYRDEAIRCLEPFEYVYPLELTPEKLSADWTKVEKTVDFITAIKSGKAIKPEKWVDGLPEAL